MSEPETRRRIGITEYLLHRANGESAWISAFDARATVRNHPEEWAFQPFSAAQQKAAQVDMPIDPANVRRGEAGFVPVHG